MPLKFFTAKNLQESQVKHGFFTAEGGVSSGVYAALNCRLAAKDLPENVQKNRALIAEEMGVAPAYLFTLNQKHGEQVVIVDNATPNLPPADGMATKLKNIALGIVTADCVPVLLAEAQNQVIGAAHAGWRGATSGVLENTISAMENLGASRAQIKAAIGPAISKSSYEVGEDMRVAALDADKLAASFFSPTKEAGKFLFDLKGYVLARLKRAGVSSVTVREEDTLSDERFFSHRRNHLQGLADYGCQLSVIRL